MSQSVQLTQANIDLCSGSVMYWVFPPCWQLDHESWIAAANLTPIPASTVVAPGAPADAFANSTGAYAEDSTVGQDLSNAAILQTQGNVQDFVSSLPDNPLGTASCSWINVSCTTWAILGVVAVVGLVALGGGSPRRYGR